MIQVPKRYRFLVPAIRDGEAGLQRVREAQMRISRGQILGKALMIGCGTLVGLALLSLTKHGAGPEDEGMFFRSRRLADDPECVHNFNPFRDGDLQTTGIKLCNDGLGYIALCIFFMVYMFWTLAVVVDEDFVDILDYIVKDLNIDPDVAGATFMAAGGSAPEFFTSLISVFDLSGTGFGTIIGSAIFNILAVIAACAYFARPRQEVLDRRAGLKDMNAPWPWEPLPLTWWPLFRDSISYTIGLIVLAIFYFCFNNGLLSATCGAKEDGYILIWETVILFVLYIGYCLLMVVQTPIKRFIENHFPKMIPEAQRNNAAVGQYDGDDLEDGDGRPSHAEPKTMAGTPKLKEAQTQESKRSMEPKLPKRSSVESAGSVVPPPVGNVRWSSSRSFRGVHSEGQASATRSGSQLSVDSNSVKAHPGSVTSAAVADHEKELDGDEEETQVEVVSPRMRPTSFKRFGEDKWWKVILNNILYIFIMPVLFANLTVHLGVSDLDAIQNKFLRRTLIGYGFLMSLVWIAIYTWLMVFSAETFASTIGMPDTILGFTFLAAGTSVPDLLSSVFVSRLGYGDMAVSSSIGSNIFDILVGLPIPWLISIASTGNPLLVETGAVAISLVVIILMIISLLAIIIWQDWKLTKLGAQAMLILYFVFLVAVIVAELV